MKNILLFGAGKSSTVLIDYLLQHAEQELWKLTIADADINQAKTKISKSPSATAISLNVYDDESRKILIIQSDLIISLLPPTLHYIVAKDCLYYKKNLLTASYINEEMYALSKEIKAAGLVFLCEMGLDPGIDHMSAMKMIDKIKTEGGIITSFKSHCGGLIAPESDNNPWHYKISWNPQNVVRAGKDGAVYKQDGNIIKLDYPEVFAEQHLLKIKNETFAWYPNRNSLQYTSIYGLEECPTFIRTTLRHPDFICGWKNLVDLKFTDENIYYNSDGKTLHDIFREHLYKNYQGHWLKNKFDEHLSMINGLQTNLSTFIISQLMYIGMGDNQTFVNKGKCCIADFLQFALESKLALQKHDKDRVVMLHELEYTQAGAAYKINCFLDITGKNREYTAMAKTVGLPLAIAAKLILDGKVALTGLHRPIQKDIYIPVMQELKIHGIEFNNEISQLV